MLVFHPDLGAAALDVAADSEVVICLDCSNSMEGAAFLQAKQIALHALSSLGGAQRVNVVRFGSGERSGLGDSGLPGLRRFCRWEVAPHSPGPCGQPPPPLPRCWRCASCLSFSCLGFLLWNVRLRAAAPRSACEQ